jgi:glyoxylase-like metal-dependent hydrolase (beta-lactamase superfamily II)
LAPLEGAIGGGAYAARIPLPRDVTCISLPTPFAIGPVNAFLLDGQPLTLVDPGPHMRETLASLEAALAARGRQLADVELILLTHQHHDHVGLAEHVREASGAPIAALAPLADFLADLDRSLDMDDRYAVAIMLQSGVDAEVADSLRELSRAFRRFSRSARVERRLEDGERIEAGGRTLTVLARSGHSPTDTVFHDQSDGLLVGGDHLLERISSNPLAQAPIGTSDPERAARDPARRRPLVDYLDSMRRTAELDVSVVLPGHGEPFADHRGLIERRTRLHRRRARKVLAALERPSTAADLAARLWRQVPVTEAYLALSEALAHLDLLESEGRVRRRAEATPVVYERRDAARGRAG